MFIDVAHF